MIEQLPNEVLLEIAKRLPDGRSLRAWKLASRTLRSVVDSAKVRLKDLPRNRIDTLSVRYDHPRRPASILINYRIGDRCSVRKWHFTDPNEVNLEVLTKHWSVSTVVLIGDVFLNWALIEGLINSQMDVGSVSAVRFEDIDEDDYMDSDRGIEDTGIDDCRPFVIQSIAEASRLLIEFCAKFRPKLFAIIDRQRYSHWTEILCDRFLRQLLSLRQSSARADELGKVELSLVNQSLPLLSLDSLLPWTYCPGHSAGRLQMNWDVFLECRQAGVTIDDLAEEINAWSCGMYDVEEKREELGLWLAVSNLNWFHVQVELNAVPGHQDNPLVTSRHRRPFVVFLFNKPNSNSSSLSIGLLKEKRHQQQQQQHQHQLYI